ncbi:MAG: hypothetical protein K2Y24_10900 [Pseudomonadaceae bacterium]|nr:hypothetical protein [Pseudomonadaceae bacterium]
MTAGQFLDLYSSNLSANIYSTLFVIVLYLFIFRKSFSSIVDPLFLGVIAQAFSASVVLVMYFSDVIDDYYLYSFLATEAAFLIGCFSLFRSPSLSKLNGSILVVNSRGFKFFYFVFCVFFWVFSVLYLYSAGLALFVAESRLITMQNLGVISWFVDILWSAGPLFFFLKRYIIKNSSPGDYFLLFAAFFFLLTKGGKSDFLPFVYSFFIVTHVFSVVKLQRYMFFVTLLVPALLLLATAITLSIWGVDENVVFYAIKRFVLFGDAFFQGYTREFFELLPESGFFHYFFNSLYGTYCYVFGLVPGPKVIMGYEMSKLYYGVSEGMGANARHNILGLYLFGPYGSVLFSFFCGFLLSFLRRGFYLSKSWLFVVFYIVINLFVHFIMIDPALAVGYFIKVFVVLGVVLVVSYFINVLIGQSVPVHSGKNTHQ